jgi:hypothetical protein
MTIAANIVMTSLFAIWLAATIAVQFKNKKINRFKHWDYFSMLPTWTFFAPRPGVHDYHLMYRDKYADGTLSFWKEIEFIDHRPLRIFWNPNKRMQKSLTDSTGSLMRMHASNRKKGLYYAIPYLAVLNFVSGIDRTRLSISTQFCIVKTCGYEVKHTPQIVFYSRLHKI